jgi:hypothetical protein
MPREITDRGRVVEAIQNLALTAELLEEENGKQKRASDLEVIVQGKDTPMVNASDHTFGCLNTMAAK